MSKYYRLFIHITFLYLPEGFRMEKGAAVKLSLDTDNLYSSASFKWMALGRKPCYLAKNRCRDLRIDRVNK